MVIASMAWLRQCMFVVAAMPAMAVAAHAESCLPARRPAEVQVISDLPSPSYRHELNRARIGALSGAGHRSSDRRHAGLTQTKTAFTVKPTLEFQRLPGGRVCASLKQLVLSWRMTQLQVDVAAEYRPGSCPYSEILRHENQHVAIAQRGFQAADRSLRQQLGDMARRTQPFVITGTPQQAAHEVAQRFMAAAEPVLERYRHDTGRENAAIDTPESYRAVGARCRDW